MITLFTMAYNEGVFLQYMIDHYRTRFPNCHIVLYDNESTDDTKKIALSNNCEVRLFETENQIDDEKIRILKNTCWKNSNTDWVLICDVDELLDVTEQQLKKEENLGSTIIRSEGYNLVNMNEDLNFANIKYGKRATSYDKAYLFNSKYIQDINYNHGSHCCNPLGLIKYSDDAYKLLHYKYLNIDYHIKRNQYTFNRLSQINKKHGWGVQWHISSEQVVKMFTELRSEAEKIISNS